MIETLMSEIQAGKYAVGSQLQTEGELGERFQVSRITVRKAMEYLQNEGLVSREIGRGTFVVDTRPKLENGNVGMVAFILVGVSPDEAYNTEEIITTERYLSERGIPFSWAALTEEDLIRGRYPAALEKQLCSGVILDGNVNEAHLALGNQFGVRLVSVGNHILPREANQVRTRIEEAGKEMTLKLANEGARVVLALEPMKLAMSLEILRGYSSALAEVGQSEELLYLCENDNPPESLIRLIQKSTTPIAVVTTDCIFTRLIKALQALGPIKKGLTFAVATSARPAIPPDVRAYLLIPPAKKMQVLAAERLIELIEGKRETVFEELDCEVIPPTLLAGQPAV
ncbi:MAG: GntR family transcriptional regulator [Verrucomicrobia bacterium]|nr:GntR family transcriptional regulator [Verrucomicrobiota bacterium]